MRDSLIAYLEEEGFHNEIMDCIEHLISKNISDKKTISFFLRKNNINVFFKIKFNSTNIIVLKLKNISWESALKCAKLIIKHNEEIFSLANSKPYWQMTFCLGKIVESKKTDSFVFFSMSEPSLVITNHSIVSYQILPKRFSVSDNEKIKILEQI